MRELDSRVTDVLSRVSLMPERNTFFESRLLGFPLNLDVLLKWSNRIIRLVVSVAAHNLLLLQMGEVVSPADLHLLALPSVLLLDDTGSVGLIGHNVRGIGRLS